MLFDSQGDLIGGYCQRTDSKAINGQFMWGQSSASNITAQTGTFELHIGGGGIFDETKYYNIKGNYDLNAGTYSNLSVTSVNLDIPGFENQGMTLKATGTLTTTDINTFQ